MHRFLKINIKKQTFFIIVMETRLNCDVLFIFLHELAGVGKINEMIWSLYGSIWPITSGNATIVLTFVSIHVTSNIVLKKIYLKLIYSLKKMDDVITYTFIVRGKNHPVVKASHFLLQRFAALIESSLVQKPDVAKSILFTRLNLSEGVLIYKTTEEPTIEFLKITFVPGWTDSDEVLEYDIERSDVKKVKISVRIINTGPKEEEEYFKVWKTLNKEADFSSWKLTKDGIMDLGDGHILLYFLVNPKSLDAFKTARGKF